jgi:hypothetical protein
MPNFTVTQHDASTNKPLRRVDPTNSHTYSVATCDADGSRVIFKRVDYVDYVQCRYGHRWRDKDFSKGWEAVE